MFKNKEDFEYFLYKAKKDGATNDKIYSVLTDWYDNIFHNEYYKGDKVMPYYVKKYLDKIELSEEYVVNKKYNTAIKLLNSFYYGKSEPLNRDELEKLKDFLMRGLWQVNEQLHQLRQLEDKK